MSASPDRDVIVGFIAEVQGYLPQVQKALDRSRDPELAPEELAEAYRLVHNIRGAASMVGLPVLSTVARRGEEVLEDVASGARPLDPPTEEALRRFLEATEAYLEELAEGRQPDREFAEVTMPGFLDLEDAAAETAEEAIAEVLRAQPPARLPQGPTEPSPEAPLTAEEITPELQEIFREEAGEYVQTIGALLRDLGDQPDDRDLLQSVRRTVHSLKGAASTVGFFAVAQVSHRMEDLLDDLYERTEEISPETQNLLFSTTDVLEDLLAPRGDDTSLRGSIAELFARYGQRLPGDGTEAPPPEGGTRSPATGPTPATALIQATADVPQKGSAVSQRIRVPVERVDELVRLAGELVLQRSAFEDQLEALSSAVGEIELSFDRVRRLSLQLQEGYGSQLGQTPPLEPDRQGTVSARAGAHAADFDDLELDRYSELDLISRELAETGADVSTVESQLKGSVRDLQSHLELLGRMTGEAQEKLMRLRMVPVSSLGQRLHRAVRITAEQQGKEVSFFLRGESVELDKSLLEEVADPLLHLLRNAVHHGIEAPQSREEAGKPRLGTIEVTAFHRGTRVGIRVEDDGAGLDPKALRDTAMHRGIASEEQVAQMSDEEALRLIFLPGFSTAGEISEISGRGVGLDAVRSRVRRLQGTLEVDSEPGRGVRFTLWLPMTLAVTRVLMVRSHGEVFALPMAVISQVLRISKEDLWSQDGRWTLRTRGEALKAIRLDDMLPLPEPFDDAREHLPALVLTDDNREKALLVEEVLGAREVVIKPLGRLLRRARGFVGGTLLGDGRIVLILDAVELLSPDVLSGVRASPGLPQSIPETEEPPGVDILVVDDSLSVRRVLSGVVEDAGWKALTARDGLEALEKIRSMERVPDAVLLDIEMPRMDGYELTSTLRGQKEFSELPIIMITSRSSEKHRQKAFELGATDYLVKPYQVETLLQAIRRATHTPEAVP